MLRLWLYLAGVEASTSNYKSVEEVHAALVIPGMHEVIVVMSGLFYLILSLRRPSLYPTQCSASYSMHVESF